MNIAIFLHNNKQNKDSTIPLPLAPVYVLPTHQWYFSSPTLTPLRKRRQNTSLSKYFQQTNDYTGKSRQSSQTQFLCVYEKESYLKNKIKHIYETIYSQIKRESFERKHIQCICRHDFERNRVKLFRKNPKIIAKYQQSMSSVKQAEQNRSPVEQKVNWEKLLKAVSIQHLGAIEQQTMSLYRLPKSLNSHIFSVLCSNNYVIFNNSNEKHINQFMKSKAIKLCEMLHSKLEEHLWTMMLQHRSTLEEGPLLEKTLVVLKAMMQIEKFNVWFYKKEENNQLYIVSVNHITFKGVDCVIYNSSNFEQQLMTASETKQNCETINHETIIQEDTIRLNNKIKSYSLNINALNQDKYQQKLGKPKMREITTKDKQIVQVSYVQCACCQMALLTTEKVNEVAAKHIEQIRYLKQMRMKKKESSPYDFAKICPGCYQVYLEHYKKTVGERNRQAKILSKDNKAKLISSTTENSKIKQNYKQKRLKLPQVSLRDEIQNYQSEETPRQHKIKLRVKSELDCSKERAEEKAGDYLYHQNSMKEKSLSVKYRLDNPLPNKTKNIVTNNTENTQKTVLQRDQFLMSKNIGRDRSMTHEQPKQSQTTTLSRKIHKDRSFKIQKAKNTVINSRQYARAGKAFSFSIESTEQIRNQIADAISDYEQVPRPSFKRLAFRQSRNRIKREHSKLGGRQGDNFEDQLSLND